MRLPFGFQITRAKASKPLSGVDDSRGWVRIFDWMPGAWQQDSAAPSESVMAQVYVYACITQIAADIGKLRLRLMQQTGRVWEEATSPAFSPLLLKPNHYQIRQQFVEGWIVSKLSAGNTYALKQRDRRNVVKSLYVLDPSRVTPLIAPDGAVYYRLGEDDINMLDQGVEAVPASEIIHDRMPCLFHPLVGVTPLYAAHLPASQALKIQRHSRQFFEQQAQPGGILTAPHRINEETAARIKKHWEEGYTGKNAGKVAVLGDGLSYTPSAVTAVDAQLAEQLKLTGEQICSAFHMPAFLVGAAPQPPYGDRASAMQQYYNQCLQSLLNAMEDCLDDGLGIGPGVKKEDRTLRVEFDLDDLLRMDSKTLAEVEAIKIKGITSPDESREKFNLPPVKGGATPYLQQQNYALHALAARDESDDPFGKATPPTPAPAPAAAPSAEEGEDEAEEVRAALGLIAKRAPLGSARTLEAARCA
jgi:HK97 family phage portal protein